MADPLDEFLGTYILNDQHELVRATYREWAEWFMAEDGRRRVAVTPLGNARVSTYFVGIGREMYREPFETLIFLEGDVIGDRIEWSSWAAAEAGHRAIVKALLAPIWSR